MVKLNWREFYEKYSPIKNVIELDTPCDGHLFLDKDQLKDILDIKIWTLVDDSVNADMYITNGVKLINSMGYLVTKEPWIEEEIVEVRLQESDCLKEEDNNGEN